MLAQWTERSSMSKNRPKPLNSVALKNPPRIFQSGGPFALEEDQMNSGLTQKMWHSVCSKHVEAFMADILEDVGVQNIAALKLDADEAPRRWFIFCSVQKMVQIA